MGIIEEELEGTHYALAVNRSLIFYVIYVPERSVMYRYVTISC